MSKFALFLKWVGFPGDNAALNRAQFSVFSYQVPLMYTILLISMVALAYTHYSYAPDYLTLGVPAFLALVVFVRVINFLRMRGRKCSDQEAKRGLQYMVCSAFILGAVFVSWALSLSSYGNAYNHGHIAFFVGITSLACVVCVLHLRAAAIAVLVSVGVPFTVFFGFSGNPVFVAIAINMFLVVIALVLVMIRYSKSFEEMIAHQGALSVQRHEARQLSDDNQRIANEDFLTELPNRRSFFERLGRRLEGRAKTDSITIIGILDLDGFKPINDVYGHVAGDKLLKAVAERLNTLNERGIVVSRLGGDEFALIMSGDYEDTALLAEGERICGLLRQPFDMGAYIARMSASLGLARSELRETDTEALFERADYALYYAKQHNVGRPVIFSSAHKEAIGRRSAIDRALRDADFEVEMSLAFQPIVDIACDRSVGFEVLARWESPVLGSVPPSDFIPAAERAGLVSSLTDILFQRALDVASGWENDCYFSFNLSPYDISSPNRIQRLKDMIRASDVEPSKITFEVTETALMQEFDHAVTSLRNLRAIGAKVALDDFGTGYSSLSYLRSLPLDRLKVDRSFIVDLVENSEARAVTRTIIDLCSNLNLECVVEGVETEEQLAVLQDMGCQKIQGYYFSHPMEESAVGPYLTAQNVIAAKAS